MLPTTYHRNSQPKGLHLTLLEPESFTTDRPSQTSDAGTSDAEAFEVLIESNSAFVLKRRADGWTKDFSSLYAALAYAQEEPHSDHDALVVRDEARCVRMAVRLG